jgi:hypothetical protein
MKDLEVRASIEVPTKSGGTRQADEAYHKPNPNIMMGAGLMVSVAVLLTYAIGRYIDKHTERRFYDRVDGGT